MRPLKAKGLGSVCRYRFSRKILDGRPFSLGHNLLRPWSLMGREGIANQSIGSGSVEATFDAVFVLQGFGSETFEKIRYADEVARRVQVAAGAAVVSEAQEVGAAAVGPRLNRSQRVICRPMVGVVPRETRSDADKMMLGQRKRLRMAIAKKCKQTDGSGCEEEKRQNDEQQDAGAKASPKDLRHSAPLSSCFFELLSGTWHYGMQFGCHR